MMTVLNPRTSFVGLETQQHLDSVYLTSLVQVPLHQNHNSNRFHCDAYFSNISCFENNKMNVAQAQALLGVGGLTRLMEAAAVLAKLTGQCQLLASAQAQQPTMCNTQSLEQPQIQTPATYLLQHSSAAAASAKVAMTTTPVSQPNVVIDEDANQGSPKESLSNGSKEIFPERLMAILNDNSLSDIITWLPHGRSFVIIRPDVFTELVLPKHFPPVDSRTASKYTSFTRKLNRWGFRQATRGADTGAFHHPSFQREKPELCLEMVCQRFGGRGREKGSKDKSTDISTRTGKKAPKTPTLNKEALQYLSQTMQPINTFTSASRGSNTPVVSDDGRSTSTSDQLKSSQTSLASIFSGVNRAASANDSDVSTNLKPFVTAITNDTELTRAALHKRNETERLRAAKAMLYESYCKAIRGE